ncbi:hypothetical protein GQ600_19732 [Phytophthora cactorum]|nr:hypothetical protein GQ600_19732 [Phytophthora cactorum]
MSRPRTTGTGKKAKRHTRILVDYRHKLGLVQYLSTGHSVGEIISFVYRPCTDSDKTRKQKQIS